MNAFFLLVWDSRTTLECLAVVCEIRTERALDGSFVADMGKLTCVRFLRVWWVSTPMASNISHQGPVATLTMCDNFGHTDAGHYEADTSGLLI